MIDKKFSALAISNNDDRTISIQLSEQLVWMIASGQLQPGDKLPTIRELAKFLKINQHTARAAYKKIEEKQLIQTRQGAGSYVLEFNPHIHADKSNNSLSNTVGVIVPNLNNPFYDSFLHGVEDISNEHNFLLIACSTHGNEQRGYEYLDMLIAKRVDGLIIAPFGPNLQGRNISEEASSKPVVYVDRPEEQGFAVLLDTEGAGFRATEHLIVEHGFSRIGLITGNTKVPSVAQCFQGYKRALDTYKKDLDHSIVVEVDAFTYEKGYIAAQQLINHKNPTKAIFAAGDVLAIGAIRALLDNGFRVPEDVSVVGFNDIDAANHITPRLTTVNAPTYELGVSSMQLLNRLIQDERIDQKQVTLSTELVVRDSCGCKK